MLDIMPVRSDFKEKKKCINGKEKIKGAFFLTKQLHG